MNRMMQKAYTLMDGQGFWHACLVRGVEGFLAVAMLLSAGSLVVTLHPPVHGNSTPEKPHGTHAAVIRYEDVASMHLLGVAAQNADPVGGLARSDADITVNGIISSSNDEDSLALISVDGSLKSYRVGDALPDGETMAGIEPAAVVLSRGAETRRVGLDIKYADANATFRNALSGGEESSSWADAYLGPRDSQQTKRAGAHNAAGIMLVPAAAKPGENALSLQAIRQQRAKRFSYLKKGAPPQPP